MPDQANDLRQLVRRDADHAHTPPPRSPRLVAVTSGKGGVGATTVAVNLAMALAQAGRATILVDADLDGADVGALCALDDRYTLADVLSGARSVHEVLCRGPGGIQVVPGKWASTRVTECSPQAQERLLGALRGLGEYAEYIVLDVGSGLNRIVRRFWHAADRVLAVTTPDDVAVMNTYAAIKLLSDGDPELPVASVINRASRPTAAEVHRRLAHACRRFLGMEIVAAASVASDEGVVAISPGRKASRGFEQLARFVIDAVPESNYVLRNTFRASNVMQNGMDSVLYG